jgi:hypothetical protein
MYFNIPTDENTILVPLTGEKGKGKFILMDKEDYHIVEGKAINYHHTGYAVVSRVVDGKRKQLRLHRLIVNAQPNDYVDHKNHDLLDNRKQNLRICTNQQNQFNKLKKKDASSKYKGVSYVPEHYKCSIKYNGKNIHLGTFKTEDEAAKAYNKKAKELFGEFAILNILC